MRVFVFFLNCDGAPWWARLCKEGFRHCFIIKEQMLFDLPVLIKIENLTRVFLIDVGLDNIDELIKDIRKNYKGVRILEGFYEYKQPSKFNQFIHLNCVSVIRKALGINDWKVITPWQLFNKLKILGYKEI